MSATEFGLKAGATGSFGRRARVDTFSGLKVATRFAAVAFALAIGTDAFIGVAFIIPLVALSITIGRAGLCVAFGVIVRAACAILCVAFGAVFGAAHLLALYVLMCGLVRR